MKAWSYSAIKLFETCPRKYEAERVTKEVKLKDSVYTLYGKELHLAAQNYIEKSQALEPEYVFLQPILDTLKALDGEKKCEHKLAVTENLEPCDFYATNVWFRGIADLIVVKSNKIFVIDYKTGNSKHADTKQLDLMAAACFSCFPNVETIKGLLWFVLSSVVVEENYLRSQQKDLFKQYDATLEQRNIAYQSGIFNPKPNGLCKSWCEVFNCPHNGRQENSKDRFGSV